MAKNHNPNRLTVGDKVMLPARSADLVPHRDGNDAVWEIIGFQLGERIATLHLVGADSSRTCGSVTALLRPVK
jgi:hypothetical protein